MTLYASVEFTKSIMGSAAVTGTQATIQDPKVYQLVKQVSARVDKEFQQRRPLFAPYNETRIFPLSGMRVNSWDSTFRIDGYLLELTSTSVMGNAVTAVEGYPDSSMPPFPFLRLTDCCQGWYDFCADCGTARQVSVTGVWGLHSDYARAWLAVDTLSANMTDSATTLTVGNPAGADVYRQPYRISAGHLLKIDSEYMDVVDVSSTTLAVIRGANGTTAAAHTAGASVYRWEVMPEVQYAVARQAGLLYSRLGAYVTTEISPVGAEVRYPNDWLSEVKGVMQEFVYGI